MSYVPDTSGYMHVPQTGTSGERPVPYVLQSIGKFQRYDRSTVPERIVLDLNDPGAELHVPKVATIEECTCANNGDATIQYDVADHILVDAEDIRLNVRRICTSIPIERVVHTS